MVATCMFLCCYLPRFINIASHVKTLHELKCPPPPALCYVWLKLAESLWEIVKNQIVYLLLIKQFNSKGGLMPKWCSD